MSKEQTAKKERFLREVERQLLRKGLDSEMTEGGILNVKWHGQLLCDVDGDGVVCFPSKTVRGVDADASLQTVIQIASQVREYMPIFARAPALKAIGLEGSYKILADFGDAVLAGRLGKKGANFVTWEWDFDRNGVHMGHYFIEDYHPHEELHHIKKENIGLIEVMGLAILPGRLKKEMADLRAALLNGENLRENDELAKHADWADEFMVHHPEFNAENAEDIIKFEIGQVFAQVLECAGVYKCTAEGRTHLRKFLMEI